METRRIRRTMEIENMTTDEARKKRDKAIANPKGPEMKEFEKAGINANEVKLLGVGGLWKKLQAAQAKPPAPDTRPAGPGES